MSESSPQQQDRPRLSCEGCRRKKTKCPAERPTCSVCQRLNQQCIYLSRHRASTSRRQLRISGSGVDPERFDRLESQVSGLYEFLRQSPAYNVPLAPASVGGHAPHVDLHPSFTSGALNTTMSNSAPPAHVLEYCVHVYKSKIHAQPLQLFHIQGVVKYLLRSPRYLMYSFLALTLSCGVHSFIQGQEIDTITFYANSAHQSIQDLAKQGIAKPEMVQALCLLALYEVKVGTPAQAWMTIGVASRVEALRTITSQAPVYDPDDAERRSSFAFFMLERTFSCRTLYPKNHEHLPLPPQGPQNPLPPPQGLTPIQTLPVSVGEHSDDGSSADFATPDRNGGELDINVACTKITAAWANLNSYLYEIRAGKSEICWSPNSTYTSLQAQFCDFDTHFSDNHLLRHVQFTKRTPAEIQGHRDYWSTWILTQIAIHGSQAVLNHPFIHLIILRDRKIAVQSRVFQQQTVDQALFHSGWVARLIRSCEDVQLEINDPLIGNIVAAAATIPWIFQFARDRKIVSRTRTDTQTFERFLSRLSTMWPHFSSKLHILRDLEALAEIEQQGTPRSSINVTFKPLLVWKLLDSDISQVIRSNSLHEQDLTLTTSPDTSIHVTTKIVHPLAATRDDRSDPRSGASHEMEANIGVSQVGTYDDYMFNRFMQLDPDDFQWIDSQVTSF